MGGRAGKSGVQGQPQLRSAFENSLSCIRSMSENKQEEKNYLKFTYIQTAKCLFCGTVYPPPLLSLGLHKYTHLSFHVILLIPQFH